MKNIELIITFSNGHKVTHNVNWIEMVSLMNKINSFTLQAQTSQGEMGVENIEINTKERIAK